MAARREVEEFSVSFLDVLCCALGAVLLLLLYTMSSGHETEKREKELIKRESAVSDRLSGNFLPARRGCKDRRKATAA